MQFKVSLGVGSPIPEAVVDVTYGEVHLMGDDEMYELLNERVDQQLGPHASDYMDDFEPLDAEAYREWRRMGYPTLPNFEGATQ